VSTDPLRIIAAGDIAIREATDDDGRTVEGYAYRWGELTEAGGTEEYGNLAEGFERGAFLDAIAERGERNWPHLDRHKGTTVAGIRFFEDDIGLGYRGRLLDTPAARDYAASVPAGNDGVSLEFMYRGATSVKRGKSIIHTRIPRIAALAGAYVPAHQGASVALRDTGGIMEPQEPTTVEPVAIAERGIVATAGPVALSPDQVRELATSAATEAMRGFAERGQFGGIASVADPLAGYKSLGHLFGAAYNAAPGDELRGYAARALADTVFTAGANAGLANGNLTTQTIARIVTQSRPIIEAFGGPRPIASAGLTLNYAYFNGTLADRVAAQSAEKAEIESLAVDIALGTEALVTYAGGTDVSNQVIKRGDPSVLDAIARIILAAYAVVTDAAAATELETGSVTVDFTEALASHDLSEFTRDIIAASILVQAATGQPGEFVLASTTAFSLLATLVAASSTQTVAAGSMDLRGLSIGIGGLPIIHAPGITAGKLIVSNRQAGGWYEDGPYQASAENVPLLGRDVAYWGMGAFLRLVPAGIVEVYDVSP
jgi:HK97 family phage prohead protease